MSGKVHCVISGIVTQHFLQGAIPSDRFVNSLRESFGEVVARPLDKDRREYHDVLAWSVPPDITHGTLADAYYRIEFRTGLTKTVALTQWYRQLVPAPIQLGLILMRKPHYPVLPIMFDTSSQSIETFLMNPPAPVNLETANSFPWSDPLVEELGDARAKRLVDRAQGALDNTQAIALAQRALRYGRTGIQARKAWCEIGSRSMELEQYEQAVDAYAEVVALNPERPEGYIQRGIVYFRMGRYREAHAEFQNYQALRYNPLPYEDFDEVVQGYLKDIATIFAANNTAQ